MPPNLTIVVACYNEEEVVPTTSGVLLAQLDKLVTAGRIGSSSGLLFVDDGSTDRTWPLIESLSAATPRVAGIKLSRNVGHQNALFAGLAHVTTDVCISIDADLQDDLSVIDKMVALYNEGYQIVYGVRQDRSSDSLLKQLTAKIFYGIRRWFGVETIVNHADFRLLGDRALKALLSFRETPVFLRGLVPLVGFRSTCIYYTQVARSLGKTKHTFGKMLTLGINGVTSFSVVPLRLITLFGVASSLVAIVLFTGAAFNKLFGSPTEGWNLGTLVLFFMGSVQILALGVVGEYIGSLSLEVKQRPKYFVEKTTKQ
jgi:glycosyltransferase involved in cell wall biosynthesis